MHNLTEIHGFSVNVETNYKTCKQDIYLLKVIMQKSCDCKSQLYVVKSKS